MDILSIAFVTNKTTIHKKHFAKYKKMCYYIKNGYFYD